MKPELQKGLRWHDGVALALPIAVGLFITAGATTATIGTWGTIAVCVVLAVIALLQNHLFAEMASMFPDKAGGVAVFANEAWKRYFAPLGAVAAFGYWCGWGLVLTIVGLTMGSIIQAQWFADSAWTVSTGLVDVGLGHAIAAVALVAVTVVNLLGIKLAVRLNRVVGAVFVVVLIGLIVLPFAMGDWSADNLSFHADGPWGGAKVVIVWLYLGAWSIYGSELCASFAPEYRNPAVDTARAMKTIALILIGLYALVPLATSGHLGEEVVGADPITYGIIAYQDILGTAASSLVAAVLCAVLFLVMVSSAADAARSLYGISHEGMTVRQLGRLNKAGEPALALVLTMFVNLGVLAFVASPVAVLIAGNLGYLVAITLAVSGFLLLRKDRPQWPRSIRLGRAWIPVAMLLVVFNVVILVVGVTSPDLAAGASFKEVAIGGVLLLVGIAFYLYRRLVQDPGSLRLREPDEPLPSSSQPHAPCEQVQVDLES
ncbi:MULTISPECIES: APC family permease [Rhodococcus]|uniref:APC family permease n=1 Tax=Rhodococcus qingshengii JCM 15477 TaxID=1303681 RepID=A0AB38RNT9_RHOSG|nr:MULTISPECIES: APC family permease [Rhodococcus]MCC4306736.1 APC family permease [Rhodococcus sp. 3-2]UPU47025.1 APC family permease [Rhodococcus qingshengii JCM 15477]